MKESLKFSVLNFLHFLEFFWKKFSVPIWKRAEKPVTLNHISSPVNPPPSCTWHYPLLDFAALALKQWSVSMDLFYKLNFSKETNSIFGLKKTYYILPFSTSFKHKFISTVHCLLAHKSLLKNLELYISEKTVAEKHFFLTHFPESKILPNQLCTLIYSSTLLSSVSVLCKEQEVFTKLFLLVTIFSSYLCGPQR